MFVVMSSLFYSKIRMKKSKLYFYRESVEYFFQEFKNQDEQIKEYICEIIKSGGLCYSYYKITIMLKRKFRLIINKKKG